MFEIGNEMHYTADEVLVKYEEFANRIDAIVGNVSATELDNEIKEFMNKYMCWGDTLYGAAHFLGKGTEFNLEDGTNLDEVVEEKNRNVHCSVLNAAYKYYCECWFDPDEDFLHEDDDKVYKLKMDYLKELQKYAKENEELWVGYAEKGNDITDFEHLESYRCCWLSNVTTLANIYEQKKIKGNCKRKEVNTLIEIVTETIVNTIYMPSTKYGNIFASEEFMKQLETLDNNLDDCLTSGLYYYFTKIAFVRFLDNPEFYEEAKKLLKMYFDTTPEKTKQDCEEWKVKYEKELEKI